MRSTLYVLMTLMAAFFAVLLAVDVSSAIASAMDNSANLIAQSSQ